MSPGRFFEIDLPEMQAEKRRLAAQLVRTRPGLNDDHIVYAPCSFGENELSIALQGAGFDTSRPTIWIWSGVIHYLSEAAVQATITTLKELSVGGSQIFFDFILLEAYERPDKYGFASTKKRFDAFGEEMTFGFRQGTEHVSAWLRKQGLHFVRSYTNLDMVALYEHKTGQPSPSQGTPWSNICVAAI